MRTYPLLPLVALFLLSACGSAPAVEASELASQPTQAATSPAEVAASPTPEPSPTPSPVPLPYSGSTNPRLAWVLYEDDQPVIQVIELGAEEVVATIPVGDSWLVSLSPDGRKLFSYDSLAKVGVIYDLESGGSHTIDLSAQVSPEGILGKAVWSSSQQWLSFLAHNNGISSLWVYSLETGDLKHVEDVPVINSDTFRWSSREDIVSYVNVNQRTTYNLATGEETLWPSPDYYANLEPLLTHNGLKPDLNSPSCWWMCVQPELGQVRDYMSHTWATGQYYFDLVDTEVMELLAHVATFQTERPLLGGETYFPEVVKLFPLWERGDYLLYVQQLAGPTIVDSQTSFYSAWSPSGEMPFTVMEGEQTNTLPDVMPMAVSPDGASFVGFRITNPEPYLDLAESVVVVDLATAEILYEYRVPGTIYVFAPEVSGAHLVWPSE